MAALVKGAAEDEKKAKQLDAKIVDLDPGDVLYIPPYWNHLAMTPKPSSASWSNPLLAKTAAQEEEAQDEGAAKFGYGINIWSEAEELAYLLRPSIILRISAYPSF